MATALTGLVRNFGAPSLAKTWNEEDHPRDDDGKFSSSGDGDSGGGEDEEYGPGEGYETKDQERHDKAMAAFSEHAGGLEHSLNSVAAAAHDPDASPEKIIAAGRDAIRQFKDAGRAYDKASAIRGKYGDAAPDAGILNLDTEDLVSALKDYDDAYTASQEALTTIRENTASRATSASQAGSGRHDDAITHLERELETASSSMAARRAAMRSKPA
ncbi:hypothetical protein VQ03_03295 [Methylobacterium tarhaniae]|uniref:Uncharacterized protein n=1 Tax=Methylobacterium tarhaniae TaxID=1187852 RepID=A0A0J6TES7_9HYPH|nr:hypothetical protein [Methylobacterium tarhaniae]KMO44414.1 hypothetical protein VQ03_03295 [Methylobacterium tarhaniae]